MLPGRLKRYGVIDRGRRQGGAIHECRGLEDQGSGAASGRRMSRVGTEGDRGGQVQAGFRGGTCSSPEQAGQVSCII